MFSKSELASVCQFTSVILGRGFGGALCGPFLVPQLPTPSSLLAIGEVPEGFCEQIEHADCRCGEAPESTESLPEISLES